MKATQIAAVSHRPCNISLVHVLHPTEEGQNLRAEGDQRVMTTPFPFPSHSSHLPGARSLLASLSLCIILSHLSRILGPFWSWTPCFESTL